MREKTRTTALCGVAGALATALMLVGSLIGVGTYASPMLAGVVLLPVGWKAGKKAQFWAFVCVSVLCALVVTDWEQTLMFAGFFGWYPILRPAVENKKSPVRFVMKFLLFNVPVVLIEWLAMTVLGQETETAGMLLALWAAFNVLFFLYDRLLPRVEKLLAKRLKLRSE